MLKKSEEFFMAAERLVEKEPATLARVKLAHLPVYYARLWFQTQGERISGRPVDPILLNRFKRIARENEIEYVGPGMSVSAFLERISPDSIRVPGQDLLEPLVLPPADKAHPSLSSETLPY